MIKLAALVACVFLPSAALAADECPAFLVLNEALSMQDTEVAQRYANCMSFPSLPTSELVAEKNARCREDQPNEPGGRLRKVLDWVDHVTSELLGCETRLQIKKN